MARTERIVFNLSHELIIGWPGSFSMAGTSDEPIVATEFYMNAPAGGIIEIQKFTSIRNAEIEFCELEFPHEQLAKLPGPPVDPFVLMRGNHLKCGLTPLPLGPSAAHGDIHDVRMRLRYNGEIPPGMRGGQRVCLVAFFMQTKTVKH
jgi:hypothetical protein